MSIYQAIQYEQEKKYQKRKEQIRDILSKEDAEKIKAVIDSESMITKFGIFSGIFGQNQFTKKYRKINTRIQKHRRKKKRSLRKKNFCKRKRKKS